MGKYCVYVHISPENGKRYYGRTMQNVEKRWQRGYGYEKTPALFEDIKRLGWDAFEHTVVAQGLSEDAANALEAELIAAHDTMNPDKGYNLRAGGYSNHPAASVCRNISKAKMGHEVTEETREKLRRKAHSHPVAQFSISGALVAVHPSMTSAAKSVGEFKPNIYAVCVGRRKTARGYVWRYADISELKDRVKHDAGGAKC